MTTEPIRPVPIDGAKNGGASPENKALAGAPENKAAGISHQGSLIRDQESGRAGRSTRRHLPTARSPTSGPL
ncbi:MAG: hypothetical protein V3S45_05235, partial [Kiloniellales bacterium]